jgi:dTDP-4-dehydrorhamnose 3,5-epimerase
VQRVATDLPGVWILEPRVFEDARGHFFEAFNARTLAALGLERRFVQDNESFSHRGVLRGLHYQLGRPQAKLVRAVRGEVFDVAVDVRRGSPTFGRWTGAVLSEDNRRQVFIPEGFAHGFYVLSPTAVVLYKCSDFYAPEEERGIAWNDPKIAIAWPIPPGAPPSLSARDAAFPTLAEARPEDLPSYPG